MNSLLKHCLRNYVSKHDARRNRKQVKVSDTPHSEQLDELL